MCHLECWIELNFNNDISEIIIKRGDGEWCIHSKSGISWMEKSADDLEFSAEGLSRNAKTIKFALSGELTLQFLPNYVQVLLTSFIKTYRHCMFSLKIPFRHNILRMLIIYALLTRNVGFKINALFPQICLGWRAKSADLFTFRMYADSPS